MKGVTDNCAHLRIAACSQSAKHFGDKVNSDHRDVMMPRTQQPDRDAGSRADINGQSGGHPERVKQGPQRCEVICVRGGDRIVPMAQSPVAAARPPAGRYLQCREGRHQQIAEIRGGRGEAAQPEP